MAMLCICGVCIPYTVLWPIVLLFLKQIWAFIYPAAPKPAKTGTAQETSSTQSLSNREVTPGKPLSYSNSQDWEEVIGSDTPTVLRFTAKWCKPCKALDPYFEELCSNAGNQATFYNVDVDECDEVAALNGAITIPLFVSYRAGKQLAKLSGSDRKKIEEFVQNTIDSGKKTN